MDWSYSNLSFRLSMFGGHLIFIAVLDLYSSLPASLRDLQFFNSYKRDLKIHHFTEANRVIVVEKSFECSC